MSAFLHVKFGSGRPPEHAHQLPFAHEIEEDPTRTALHDSLKTDVQRSGVIRYLEQNFKDGSYVHDVVSSRETDHGMYALICKNWARSVGDHKLHLSLYIYQDDRHVATWHAYTDRSISYSRSGDETDPPTNDAGADPYSTAEALEAATSRAPTPAPASPDADRPRFNRPAAAPDSDTDGVETPFETSGLSSKPASPTSAEGKDVRSPVKQTGRGRHDQESESSLTIRKAASPAHESTSPDIKRANSPDRPVEASRASRSSRQQRRRSTSSEDEAADDKAYPIVESKPIGRTPTRLSPPPCPSPSPPRDERTRSDRTSGVRGHRGDSDAEAGAPAERAGPSRRQRIQRRREPPSDARTPSPRPRPPARSPFSQPAQSTSRPPDCGRRSARSPSAAESKSPRNPSPIIKDDRADQARRSSRRLHSPSPDATEGQPDRLPRGRDTTKPMPAPVASAPAQLVRTPSWRSVSRNRHRRDDSDEDTLVRGNLEDHELDIPAGGETTLLEAKHRSAWKDRSARRARYDPKDEGFDPKEVEKPPVPLPKPTAKAVLGGWLKSVGTLLKIEGELTGGEVEQKVLEHEVDEDTARAQRKEQRRLRREARAARRTARAKQEEEAEERKSRNAGRAADQAFDSEADHVERKKEKKVEKRREEERERKDISDVDARVEKSSRRTRQGLAKDEKVDRRARDVSPESPKVDTRRGRSSRHRHHGSSYVESPSELDDEDVPPAPRQNRAMSVSATLDKGMQNFRNSVADIVSNVSGTRKEIKPPRAEEDQERGKEEDDDDDYYDADFARPRRQHRQSTTEELSRQTAAPRRRGSLSNNESDTRSRRSVRQNKTRSPPRQPTRLSSAPDSGEAEGPSRSACSRSRRRQPRPPSPSESSAAETVSTRWRDNSPDSVNDRRRHSTSRSEEERDSRHSKHVAAAAPPASSNSASYARSAYDRKQSPPRPPAAQREQRLVMEADHLARHAAEHVGGAAAGVNHRAREEVQDVEDKLRRVERRDDRMQHGRLNDPYSRDDASSRRLSPLTTSTNKHDPSALPPIVSPASTLRLPRSYANESPIRPQPVRPIPHRTTVSRTAPSYQQDERDGDESSDASRPDPRRRARAVSSDEDEDYSRRSRQSPAQSPASASQSSPYRFPPPASAPSSRAFSDRSFPQSDLDYKRDSRHRNVRSSAPSPSLSPEPEPEPVKQRGRNLSFTRSKGENYDPFGSSSEESDDSEEEYERSRERETERSAGGGGGGSRTMVGGGARSGPPRRHRRNDSYGDRHDEEDAGRQPFGRTTVGKTPSHLSGPPTTSRTNTARPSTFSPTSFSRSPYSNSFDDSYDARFALPSHSSRYSPSFTEDDDPRFSPSHSPSPYENSNADSNTRTRTKVGVSGSAQTFGRFGAPVSRRAARRLGL